MQCPHLDAAPVLGPGHPALVSAGVGPALWTVHNQVISRQSWTGTSGNIRYYDPVCNICFSSLSHVFPCGFLKVLKVIIDERLLINCQNKYHNILNSKMWTKINLRYDKLPFLLQQQLVLWSPGGGSHSPCELPAQSLQLKVFYTELLTLCRNVDFNICQWPRTCMRGCPQGRCHYSLWRTPPGSPNCQS